jgi:hypothetical protein
MPQRPFAHRACCPQYSSPGSVHVRGAAFEPYTQSCLAYRYCSFAAQRYSARCLSIQRFDCEATTTCVHSRAPGTAQRYNGKMCGAFAVVSINKQYPLTSVTKFTVLRTCCACSACCAKQRDFRCTPNQSRDSLSRTYIQSLEVPAIRGLRTSMPTSELQGTSHGCLASPDESVSYLS